MSRVKISRTIDLEEIPNEVVKYLNDAVVHASVVSESLKSSIRRIQNKNIPDAIKSLEELRLILFKLDNAITDNSSILQGYNQAVSQEVSPPAEPQAPPAPEPQRGTDE